MFRSDAEAVSYFYALANDHMPDFNRPTWLNEKIRWQFLHHPNPLLALAADKLAVRDYLAWRGADIAPPALIASGSSAEEICDAKLPASFVLKSTNGCNQIHVETPGMRTPRSALAAKLRAWFDYDLWRLAAELHYRDVPKRWLVEEYLPSTRQRLEYKVFCFMGEPRFVTVITERAGREFRRVTLDTDWRRVAFATRGVPPGDADVPRPPELERMLAEARRLSAEFLHVRVDFLGFDERIAFSELTFTPRAARLPVVPRAANLALGDLIDLGAAPVLLARGRQVVAALMGGGAAARDAPLAVEVA